MDALTRNNSPTKPSGSRTSQGLSSLFPKIGPSLLWEDGVGEKYLCCALYGGGCYCWAWTVLLPVFQLLLLLFLGKCLEYIITVSNGLLATGIIPIDTYSYSVPIPRSRRPTRQIHLIDTPGFNDTTRSDIIGTLDVLASYLGLACMRTLLLLLLLLLRR